MLKIFKQQVVNRMQQCSSVVLRRFAKEQDGSTAVEFGLIAAPFLALLFAILETALVFFSSQALETAVADASRLIMTGQAQTQGMSQKAFKDAVCERIYGLFDCQSGVYVDVKSYSFGSFSGASLPVPIDGQGNFQNNFSYNPGGPGDIVVVRLFYQWPIASPESLFKLTNMNGGKRLLVATSAFVNEPYAK
jgi:Flp pilus assembly protein TadG